VHIVSSRLPAGFGRVQQRKRDDSPRDPGHISVFAKMAFIFD
jgi:hypothetical protein